jgi:hypothetical protein
MDEILQSIGALTLLVGFGYFVLKQIDTKDQQQRDAKALFPYSENVGEAAARGASEFELTQLLEDPAERAKAEAARQQHLDNKQYWAERVGNWQKRVRKAAYGHEEAIFSAFDEDYAISYSTLLSRVAKNRKISIGEAESVAKLWFDNQSVERENITTNSVPQSTESCRISYVLRDDKGKLTEDDITQED